MTEVVIAGGAGFLGSHLVDRLLERSDVSLVQIVDNLWTGSRDNLAHLRDPRVKIAFQDIETFQSHIKYDEVYHLASPAAPCAYSSNPSKAISANVIGAFRLRELLAPGGQFVFTSTSEVYGDPLVSPQPETYRGSVDCTGPRSSYDESKRCTEALLFESRRVDGLRIKVVRLFNVYGPRMRTDDGRAVSNFVTQALSGVPITVYGSGQQTRSWGYVSDVIDALERYFWRDGLNYPGPVNIGNDREVPVLAIANYVAGLVAGTRLEFLPPLPHDPSNRCPDLTLARRLLPGWQCHVQFEEGVQRTLAWFSEQMAGASIRRLGSRTDSAIGRASNPR
jgi:nucleoside-diphosphate-sugar epimerase